MPLDLTHCLDAPAIPADGLLNTLRLLLRATALRRFESDLVQSMNHLVCDGALPDALQAIADRHLGTDVPSDRLANLIYAAKRQRGVDDPHQAPGGYGPDHLWSVRDCARADAWQAAVDDAEAAGQREWLAVMAAMLREMEAALLGRPAAVVRIPAVHQVVRYVSDEPDPDAMRDRALDDALIQPGSFASAPPSDDAEAA